jgi:hypothetical protein
VFTGSVEAAAFFELTVDFHYGGGILYAGGFFPFAFDE